MINGTCSIRHECRCQGGTFDPKMCANWDFDDEPEDTVANGYVPSYAERHDFKPGVLRGTLQSTTALFLALLTREGNGKTFANQTFALRETY